MPATIFPTGTTIYQPEKCWNGYTIFQARDFGAVLIDMNGNTVNRWKDLPGLPGPNKMLPGGYVMGTTGQRDPKQGFQDNINLVQVDWNGKIVWKFEKYERVKDPRRKPAWMARQHHDYQREGNPVGYFVPGMEPRTDAGNTLIACHRNIQKRDISEKRLLDDTIIEVTWDGEIVWEWSASEHFNEMGFSEEAKNVLARNPNMLEAGGGMGDWLHMNSISLPGPNKLYESGDERFHPDNIIWSSRTTNILAITDKKTGKIVWQVGPDYGREPARKLKQIIGPHHVHLIPRGLPGEGNMLVFDNGGFAGYGAPNPSSPDGRFNALRDHSRVIEFDPLTLDIVWQYPDPGMARTGAVVRNRLYSSFMSSAQRLVNGNTLITEGSSGRLFEVTPEGETVWEYISPYWGRKAIQSNIYRAYRLPYEWVPQMDPPQEIGLPPVDNRRFTLPGTPRPRAWKVTRTGK